MKQKKAEEECGFYRAKFSELEDRLKKLIITHHGQVPEFVHRITT